MMIPSNIPDDLNVELLLEQFPSGKCKVSFRGMHKRNAYSDIIELDKWQDDCMRVVIGRNSLYNALPEYLFHPIDRFSNLPKQEEKERFAEEYERQEKEKENAYSFFGPIDLYLLLIKIKIRQQISQYVNTDKVLMDIIGDEITPEQQANRFIKRVIPFLPISRDIRGNKTLLTLMLRKSLMNEGLKIEAKDVMQSFTDSTPRYDCSLGGELNDCYMGNCYNENVNTYDIHYWNENECDEHFLTFIDEINQFRQFIQDYFMSIDELITFNIINDAAPLRLNDEVVFNYLNYNTNI